MNQQFLERLSILLGDRYSDAVLSFSQNKLPTFRVNTLVITEEAGISWLQEQGFEIEKVEILSNAYVLKNKTKRELTDLPQYADGWFYLQSLSSMVPVASIGSLESSLHALDMCAAPGSKTSQLAAIVPSGSFIDAYDLSRQRLFQMKSVLAQLKVNGISIHQGDATGIWRKFGPVFDVVLLDAVCSGEGRFKESDPKTYSDWELKKIKKMSELQKRLIFSGIMCLKPGGVLMYSTCTFAPEEDESIINFALQKFEGAIEIEDIPLAGGPFEAGLPHWQEEIFDSRVRKAVRIVPNGLWDGFFVCRIRRN